MTGAAYLMGAARIPDFSRNHGAAPARGLAEPNPRMEKCTVTVTAEPVDLKPATPEDLAEALASALRYSGRKQVRDCGEILARIVADRCSIWSDRASSS
jgi:hypothetical protein